MGRELVQDSSSHGLTDEDIIHIPGLLSRWVRLANGARAHYVTSGESGPAVILLHGGIVGSSGTAGWRFMAPFLGANGFRVYCPDQPAFGWADTREAYLPELGPLSHVQFVNDFADALCLDRFHLSGNSMGCINTVNYVITYPERVISFALIAGFVGDIVDAPRIPPSEGKFTPNPAYVNPPFDGSEESMRVLMAGIIYAAGAVWPELVTMRTKAALRQAESQKAMARGRERIANDPALQQKLSTKGRLDRLTTSIPSVYLYGMNDVLLPVENGWPQEDALPAMQFFYPNECGHQGQTDQPDMFNQLFLEFFRDGKVSRKTADWAGISKRRPELANLVEQAQPARV